MNGFPQIIIIFCFVIISFIRRSEVNLLYIVKGEYKSLLLALLSQKYEYKFSNTPFKNFYITHESHIVSDNFAYDEIII